MTRIIELSFNTKLVSPNYMALTAEVPKEFWQYNLPLEAGRCYVSAYVDTLSKPALQKRRWKTAGTGTVPCQCLSSTAKVDIC